MPLLTFFDWFAYGMALAVVSVALQGATRQPRPVRLVVERPALCWGAALAVYAVLTALVAHAPQHHVLSNSQAVEEHVLQGTLACLIVLPAVFVGAARGWPRRVLSWGWLRWLGEISYGIYLWHLPLLLWLYREGVHFPPALLAATLAWTIVCASASYYLVERPLLRFKDRGPRLRPPQRTGERLLVAGAHPGAVPAGRR
jgi:peptidoglycan/LPS O-acetylase OafA/YrhL